MGAQLMSLGHVTSRGPPSALASRDPGLLPEPPLLPVPLGILLFLPKEKRSPFPFWRVPIWASDSFKVTFKLFLSPEK